MHSLLQNLRHINRLVQTGTATNGNYNPMASALHEVLHSAVTIIDVSGQILGHADLNGHDGVTGNTLDPVIALRLTRLDDTVVGPSEQVDNALAAHFGPGTMVAVPLVASGRRVGTLVASGKHDGFGAGDQMVAEYAGTLLGVNLLRENAAANERKNWRKSAVDQALGALSFSEQEAVRVLFEQLKGDEGIVVASRIADSAGLTRSVIVNALRKLESAGVITSRSLGMKGTFIRVLNSDLVPAVKSWS